MPWLTRFPDANLNPLRSKTHADMTDLSLTILPEAAGDAQAIERLHERTFGPGRFVLSACTACASTSTICSTCRSRPGSARCWSARSGNCRCCVGDTQALLLGPLTVEPPFRGRGVGRHSAGSRARSDAKEKGTSWWCWSATSPITAASASRRCRRAAATMPGPVDYAPAAGVRARRGRFLGRLRRGKAGLELRRGGLRAATSRDVSQVCFLLTPVVSSTGRGLRGLLQFVPEFLAPFMDRSDRPVPWRRRGRSALLPIAAGLLRWSPARRR